MDRHIEVALVHRWLRDDWTLAGGRLDPGEDLRTCALREVTEETGYTCDLRGLVAVLEYQGDDDSVLHRFHIFEMRLVSGAFVPNPETDAIAWLTPSDAIARASYGNVRALLALAPERLHSISTTGRPQR